MSYLYKRFTMVDGYPEEKVKNVEGVDPEFEYREDLLHKDAHEEGGIALNDKKLIEVQRVALKEWIQAIGKKLMTGQINLLNTSFPVKIFEARSYLQKMADSWPHTRFLHHAATAVDSVDRMQMVIAWFFAGAHHSFERWGKPFNPILGETWQAKLADGTVLYMEQVSHRPPVSAFQMVGPNNLFIFEGTSEPVIKSNVTQYGFKSVPKGKKQVRFKDGGVIHILWPSYVAKGVINSTVPRAEMVGSVRFVDVQNRMVCDVAFGPVKGSMDPLLKRSDSFGGQILQVGQHSPLLELHKVEAPNSYSLSGMFSTSKKMFGRFVRTPSMANTNLTPDDSDLNYDSTGGEDDTDSVTYSAVSNDKKNSQSNPQLQQLAASANGSNHRISNVDQNTQQNQQIGGAYEESEEKVLSECSGSWCSHIDFDGERFWTLKKERASEWIPLDSKVPSDCSNREDLIFLASGDQEQSQTWKNKLEQLQRADRKLRPQTDFQ